MSLVKFKSVKPSYSRYSEGWQEWLKTSKGRIAVSGAVGESGDNSYHVSIHHHGGVSGDGMFGSNMEISREILTDAEPKEAGEATCITSCQNSKGVLVCQEVGVAHSSARPARERSSCKGSGAKEPYLVNVNREAKEERWLENR